MSESFSRYFLISQNVEICRVAGEVPNYLAGPKDAQQSRGRPSCPTRLNTELLEVILLGGYET